MSFSNTRRTNNSEKFQCSIFLKEFIEMRPIMMRTAARVCSRQAHTAVKPSFQWMDALNLRDQLTEEELMVQETATSFCQEKLMPRILLANRNESFDRKIMQEMGELGLLGPTVFKKNEIIHTNNLA